MVYLEGPGALANVEADEDRDKQPVSGWYWAAPVALMVALVLICLVQNGR
jgi:hypothetical protein